MLIQDAAMGPPQASSDRAGKKEKINCAGFLTTESGPVLSRAHNQGAQDLFEKGIVLEEAPSNGVQQSCNFRQANRGLSNMKCPI